ncbi:hypothetical protein [Leptolyngbya sp. 7M]|uniref:hypothetical protein n=1 Tax=Leptolyngbya sp. 7M TaxID=2812896 RepID=UPI001B8AA842|nr:hypothetical protein [Leptolyngbya sp. 7M]QYO66854.1 hypothetical protein JVX88_08635 [Leptolyngbya sp. 7M]
MNTKEPIRPPELDLAGKQKDIGLQTNIYMRKHIGHYYRHIYDDRLFLCFLDIFYKPM